MIDRLQITIDGLMIGASYALIALGFTLIFGTMRRLNLAYGPTIMAGAYLGALAFSKLGTGGLAVALIVVAGAVAAGLYVERLCFRPFGDEARLASMVSSFAIWMQIEEALTLLLPSHTNAFPALVRSPPLEVGPFLVRAEHVAMGAVAAVAAVGVHLLLTRTRLGLAIRTVIESPLAARIVGVPVERVLTLAFLIASGLGGLAGFLIAATDSQVTPMLGMWATTKGLIAMMLGGLGSLRGAIAGGLALGLIEAHVLASAGPQVRDLVAWGLLFVVLALWPGGLLGGRWHDAAAYVRRRV
jgi:branched-subunit amino acid ABC-type transport system permease component